jgi:transcriptional regulator with XRE-family HTH domain
MKKRVVREHIDRWIKDAYPNGLYKLSEKTGIPMGSIAQIRIGAFIPKAPDRRKKLAEALGVKESELFPEDKSGKSRAS